MPRSIVIASAFFLMILVFLSMNVLAADQLDGTDLLVIPDGDHEADLHLNDEITYVWTVCNSGADSYHVSMTDVKPDDSFSAEVSPTHFDLGPIQGDENCADASLIVTAPSIGEEMTASIGVDFVATNLDTNQEFNETYYTVNRLTGITPPADPEGKILGQYDNPFPSPLDNKYGAFVISFLIWVLIAVVLVGGSNLLARKVARTETHLDDMIVEMMKGPIFALIVVIGLQNSLEIVGLHSDIQGILDTIFGVLLIVLFTWIAYKVFKDILVYYGRVLSVRTQSDMDDRLIPVISKIGGLVIIILGLIFIMQSFGYDITLFLAGMGVMGLIIAFAAQDTLSNFFSGIFLLLDRPFTTGDLIQLDSGEVCKVAWVGMRSTKLYHMASHEMIVLPNNMLAEQRVVNVTLPDTRGKTSVSVGVGYGTNIDRAKNVLFDIIKSHPNVLSGEDQEPLFRVTEFADSSINLKVIFWVDEVDNKWRVESELKEMIDVKFKEENIEIPFPQRVVYMHQEQKM